MLRATRLGPTQGRSVRLRGRSGTPKTDLVVTSNLCPGLILQWSQITVTNRPAKQRRRKMDMQGRACQKVCPSHVSTRTQIWKGVRSSDQTSNCTTDNFGGYNSVMMFSKHFYAQISCSILYCFMKVKRFYSSGPSN